MGHYRDNQKAPGIRDIKGWSGSIKLAILLSKTDSFVQYSTSKNHITVEDKVVPRRSNLVSNISHPPTNNGRPVCHTLTNQVKEENQPRISACLPWITTCLSPNDPRPRAAQIVCSIDSSSISQIRQEVGTSMPLSLSSVRVESQFQINFQRKILTLG